MGIDRESDAPGSLQIGPTSEGMVRIYVEGEGFDLPLDFDPDEAEEIAEELRLAAEAARRAGSGPRMAPAAPPAGKPAKPGAPRRDPRRGR